MIEATICLKNGDTITTYSKDHVTLFADLDMSEVEEVFTRTIRVADMRQGKEKRMEANKE